jgi:YfiH family protein
MNLTVKEKYDKTLIYDKDVPHVEMSITKRNHAGNADNIFLLRQTHSDIFVFLNKKESVEKLKNEEGDAIVSTVRNLPVAVRTADCLPIFFYSSENYLTGICHAGWRGTAKKIIEKVVNFLLKNLHYEKKHLNFIMGPAICEKCYEVKKDMVNAFLKEFGEQGKKFFKNSRFNLKKANLELLLNCGIEKNQIFNLNKCTVCNNRDYFSYRLEKTDKRIINSIMLK